MVDAPGRCRELDYCSIGQMRTLVRIPLGRPFVCPECGRPLRAPASLHPGLTRSRVAIWSGAIAACLVMLYVGLRPAKPKHPRPVLAVQQALLAAQDTASARARIASGEGIASPDKIVPAAPPPVQSSTPTVPARGPISPAEPPQQQILRPSALPPPRPPGPTARGKVVMVCSLDAAGVPSDCTPANGTDQPAGASQTATMPKPPVAVRPASPPPAPLPPAPLPPAPPPPGPRKPEPRILDRPFSPRAVAGGQPAYPSDHIHDGRHGEVTVECTIDETGEPGGCIVHDVQGGRRFAEATVNWLNNGTVRFAPILQGGRPVAREERWRISFSPAE